MVHVKADHVISAEIEYFIGWLQSMRAYTKYVYSQLNESYLDN